MLVLICDTYRSELGKSTWKFLHLLTAKFPNDPNEEQKQKLHTFFKLFSELYPCDECSYHFQQLIEKFPPQTNSSNDASLWLCNMHNLVNQRLDKPIYDCSKLSNDLDCDCGLSLNELD